MKFFSIVKAVLSSIIWGLGQLLNGQYLKALFFFVFFIAFIGIELGTSNYFEESHAYDKLIGNDFGDDWVTKAFMVDYKFAEETYQPFDDYLIEIGIDTSLENPDYSKLTEDLFIVFLARDLKENNPITYTNPVTKEEFLASEFDDLNKVHLLRRQNLYKDEAGLYYVARNVEQADGTITKEFVETTVLTGELNENNILTSSDNLTTFIKTGDIFIEENQLYAGVIDDENNKHLNLLTEEITVLRRHSRVDVMGPLYLVDDTIFEYFEPALLYNAVRLQYQETPFFEIFRQSMVFTYAPDWNRYTSSDFTRLMIKVHFELNPDVRDRFIADFDHFFYDKAGLFIRGYWALGSLGSAHKISFSDHMALSDAMVGNRDSNFQMSPHVSILDPVPLKGHVSVMLLLEGLIGVILSFFFFIIMFWNVRDAYNISEKKRKDEKVTRGTAYFKELYESSFEYIVLSPALFVLAFISIMPIAFGFIIAFTSIQGHESMIDTFDWVGFDNFFAIFNFTTGLGDSFGRAFWRVLGWTVVWAILSTFTVFFGGFFQALILNSEHVVFRKLWRTIFILPWAIPALLSQMVFSVMFNEFGFINVLVRDIGIYEVLFNWGMLGVDFDSLTGISRLFYLGRDNIQWFSNPFNPTFVRGTLVAVNIWLGFPFFMALMTGVMTAIDTTLYEAADIDGATRFQKISQITMPLVLYSTAPILIMTFSGNFNNFGVIYFITGGGPNDGHAARGFAGDTDILISWMYKLTVDYAVFNMASVFSVLIFLFVGSVTAWNLSKTRAFTED